MKYFISVIISLLFVVQATSCKKDFLNNIDDGALLLRQEYVVDLRTTGEYLLGIYVGLNQNVYAAYQTIYPELVADNIKPVLASSGTTPLLFHYNWAQQKDEISTFTSLVSNSLNNNGLSYGGYQVIRSCNFVLAKIEEYGSEDPARANMLKGQALAIRALVYFSMVNVFAQPYSFTADGSHPGIALIASPNWPELITRRNTVSEVYNQMISDLSTAIQLLPPNTAMTTVMSRNAAKALLARIYLFKGDFMSAKNLAAAVSRDVPIMTTNYPAKLFTPEETEALFQLPPGTRTNNSYTTTTPNVYFRSRIQFKATSDVALLLTENTNDLRKSWVTLAAGSWSIVKFPSGATTDPTTDKADAYYQTILRSSEMYLTAAECYAQLNNKDSALFYLNAIQRRANASLTGPAVTGTALLDSIYKERRKELSFEGLRMFDLLRNKKEVVRTDVLNGSPKNLSFPNSKAVSPIPVLDVSTLGLLQNDEY